MKKETQLSDIFLDKIVSVLEIGNFRFTKETMNTKITIDDVVKRKVEQMCNENKEDRIRYNKSYAPNKNMNINWSYDVMKNYFNLDLLK